ncbi:MAG: Fic family protein [Phycisphaeraceae bacterium]|nr:MAG: Fic family protein [Phycisphaeraceae bacterium]
MRWNWEKPDWPDLRWDAARLHQAEARFMLGAGELLGVVRHVPESDRQALTIATMSDEAMTTSEIEGEILERRSVQSSIRRNLGLEAERVPTRPAEAGIGELVVDLYKNWAAPLTDESLHAWHAMVCKGRLDLRDLGRYRTHEEPMQIVSGAIYAPRVHFVAPPSDRVPAEMARFINWFNSAAPGADSPLAPLARSGAAHLAFESIHPYEDGNGRIGRAISEKALAQGLGRPSLIALASTILTHRAAYYRELERANTSNEITNWLAWFAAIAIEAQHRTLANVEFTIEKSRLFESHRERLNSRQTAVMLRVLREGPDGFKGGLSASNYMAIAKTSAPTATRDLGDLVDLGILSRTGERKSTRYHIAMPTRRIPRVSIDADGNVIETLPDPI